jgi:hypothetical protein
MSLRSLGPDIWIAEQPLAFFGVELGTRMTVLRSSGSRLLVHSPIALSSGLAAEIDKIGRPAFVVAPNRFHHLYAGDWQRAYPDARLYVAPGLETKRRDLEPYAILRDDPEPDWAADVDQAAIAGFPLVSEIVLFHRASGTLIASDLLFNIGASSPPLTRMAFRLSGAYGKPSSTVLEKLFVRDRAAFRRSLEKILAWPVSRIVLAHGDVVETDAKESLRRAYSWILGR